MTSTFAHAPATIRVGDTEVSRLGFGAMQLPGPGVWGEPRDPDAARAVLRRVVDCGIRLIDTSWYYGPHVANRLIAETLYPYPKDLLLATKLGGARTPDKGWVPALSPEALRRGCEEDLRGLRLDRCAYVHLRHIPNDVPFLESLDAMIALHREGKIGHIALSNVTLAQLQEALQRTPIAGVQNLYNVVLGERSLAGIPHTVVQDQEQIVDLCAANDMAFLPFFPLAMPGAGQPASPALTAIAAKHDATQAQVAIAWLLARSPTMVPIPGTSSVAHLDENWAARELTLTDAEIATITQARA
jgi:pyridoxine 4-dehydrogenase